jgi:uncharacterized damage-inducible protein DinB
MIGSFVDEYRRYRQLGQRALAQVPDEALNRVTSPDGNSLAMIVRHVGGNLVSRFTDFLTSDGEKSWRNRESEFEERPYTRAEVDALWERGFQVLEAALASLQEADLARQVVIRDTTLTVHEALCRSLAHTASHTGQIVLLARQLAPAPWQSLSIPRGGSAQYNANPTLEKPPR